MAYKVKVTRNVIHSIDLIDEYCISHFENYTFSKKLFQEILKAKTIVENNPLYYPIYHNGIRKIVLKDVRYNLYYYFDEKNGVITFYKLKAFREEQ